MASEDAVRNVKQQTAARERQEENARQDREQAEKNARFGGCKV